MEHEQQGDTAEMLTVDAVLDLLSHRRRRAVVELLRKHGDPLALPDLADEIAVREHGERITAIPAGEVQDIYFSLYHRYVPELADYGVVAYDQDRDLVSLAHYADHLVPFLERTDAPDE